MPLALELLPPDGCEIPATVEDNGEGGGEKAFAAVRPLADVDGLTNRPVESLTITARVFKSFLLSSFLFLLLLLSHVFLLALSPGLLSRR